VEQAAAIRQVMRDGRHLAILGGGFIGLELAAMGRALGAMVTLIEVQPRVLMRGVPKTLALALQTRHQAEDVDIICGVGIETITESDTSLSIALADGRRIDADALVVGIGAEPNTALAGQAGLALENGIAVDDHLRTSDTDIFAAGDCCSYPVAVYGGRRVRLESWRNAQEQGNVAAANMLGKAQAFDAVPWFWSDQYDLKLQIAGIAFDADQRIVRGSPEEARFSIWHLAGERVVSVEAIGSAAEFMAGKKLIASGKAVDPVALADMSVPIKDLI
jgi:3-phenylpropionate/trans-cinnamate dioxygenase ferredoxin reductase subunit